MRKQLLLAVTFLGLTSSALAEKFICQGTGRFSVIGSQSVSLDYSENPQKVLLENDRIIVQVNIDKSNTDGSHYFSIEVLDLNKTGVRSIRGAKGSIKDLVMYLDSSSSIISCLPTVN